MLNKVVKYTNKTTQEKQLVRTMLVFRNIILDTVAKTLLRITPWSLLSNPILMIVWFAAAITTCILVYTALLTKQPIAVSAYLTFWLWMTLFFIKLTEVIIENKWRGSSTYFTTIQDNQPPFLKRLKAAKSISELDLKNYEEIDKNSIESGDLLLLKTGDIVPFDGIIVRGEGYVNEVDSTGELNLVFKQVIGDSKLADNALITGSLIESSEYLLMRVDTRGRKSFYAKLSRLLEVIDRQILPSEVALHKIITGLTILFISVIFTIAVIANYSGIKIPPIYLLALTVVLLPTTISSLEHAMITYNSGILRSKDIIIRDKMVLDNAADINVVIFDKTGTLTVGQREMIDFTLFDHVYEQDINRILYYVSIKDDTTEGETIKNFAEYALGDKKEEIDFAEYQYLAFSHSSPISGCRYKGYEIRKGGVAAICKYLGITTDNLPQEILLTKATIAKAHGTALLLTVNRKIVGVIHLRDKLRKLAKKYIEMLHQDGLKTIMITGDNNSSASYVAKKLGIPTFYAEATPEKKLDLIRDLQLDGYNVAMYGDGVNDSLALAQADIGISFADTSQHVITSSNVVVKQYDLSAILDLRDICRRMHIKRGALMIFSLFSDITKYFVIVPALFTTAFPSLSVLNIINFHSLESVLLASVIFNALSTIFLTPVVFKNRKNYRNKLSLLKNIIAYGLAGILSPFIFIKIFDMIIYNIGLV